MTSVFSLHFFLFNSAVFGLEGELLKMGAWSVGLGAIGAAIAGIFLANTDLCLPKVAEAPLEYLENTDLRSTIDGEWAFFIPKILIFLTSAVVKTFRKRISPTRESVSQSSYGEMFVLLVCTENVATQLSQIWYYRLDIYEGLAAQYAKKCYFKILHVRD